MKSKRYSSLKIGDVKNVFDVETDTQFLAMTFKGSGFTRQIVFRGTDGTLCGWKEDCNLTILDEIPAQREAVIYVNNAVKGSILPFNIIGHSKGGNLAEYAAYKINKKYIRRLKGVYNHDGPGFDKPELFDQAIVKKLAPKMHKVVPGESVIGMLLKQTHDYKVILSEKATFFQHGIFKWVLDDKTGDLVILEDRSKGSYATEKAIREWLDPMPHDDRVLLVNTLFEILRWDGRTTLYEVTALTKADLLKIVAKVLFKYKISTNAFLIKNIMTFLSLRDASKKEIETVEKKKKASKKATNK
ncbi:MAG: DUF2974 domain-containing protein [Enterococcus sp.]|nr:DUF2974 domain-containing protein [Enterococcus sp.]